MNLILRNILFSILMIVLASYAKAQDTANQVVQLYGVVMTADSLTAIPLASIAVVNKGRGTLTNDEGVFSIAVLKGDTIRFSCVGFKDYVKVIPTDLENSQYSVIQLLVSDTTYLPMTILRPRPSKEQFERDFVNADVPDDLLEIARKNNSKSRLAALMAALPMDGREAVKSLMQQQDVKTKYNGQAPPMNILNPAAWAEFIKAWKRGDFKKQ